MLTGNHVTHLQYLERLSQEEYFAIVVNSTTLSVLVPYPIILSSQTYNHCECFESFC